MNANSPDNSSKLNEQDARYVVDTQGRPVAVLLTLEEYEHYLDLLDDERDSQDEEIISRLKEASSPAGPERVPFREYLRSRKDVKVQDRTA